MTPSDSNGLRPSSLERLLEWMTLDHLCGVAVIAFVVIASALLFAAYANHMYVLHWAVATSLKYIEPGMTANSTDLAKLQVGAQAFEAARSKLLDSDAITFLVELMIVIVITVAIKVFSGSEKKLRQAEERLDKANQIFQRLASFIGATSSSLSASTLAGMVDRNLDRLANELAVSTLPSQGNAVAGVMGDWLKSLKETLTDPHFVKIGIPRPTLNALYEDVAQIEGQLETMNLTIEGDIRVAETKIGNLVRDWLVSSKAPEPHDIEEGARRLREIASLLPTLNAIAGSDAEILAVTIKPRLLLHEHDNYVALISSIGNFYRMDTDLHRMQSHQVQLYRLRQAVKQCREALREELCLHWEDFNKQLKYPKA